MYSTPQFATERFQLAIYLHATGKLQFAGCHPKGGNRAQFVFHDPNGIGDQLEFEFDKGALLPATDLFASQKYLRRKLSETMENRKIGGFGVSQHALR